MDLLEILVLSLGVPFMFIEIYEMVLLRRSQQRLTQMWEDFLKNPEFAGEVLNNLIISFMRRLEQNPEDEKTFVRFLQGMAILSADGVFGWLEKISNTPAEKLPPGLPKGAKKAIKTLDAVMSLRDRWKQKAVEKVEEKLEEKFLCP